MDGKDEYQVGSIKVHKLNDDNLGVFTNKLSLKEGIKPSSSVSQVAFCFYAAREES